MDEKVKKNEKRNNKLYCLKCRKNIESKNQKVARTKNGKIMLLSKRAVSDSEKSNLSNSKKLVD